MPEPKPEDEKGKPKPPPPPPHEVPPHILKKLFDLEGRVGRIEGVIEVLLKNKSV